MTPSKKGWGVRALEKIPARSFVFEYVGEVCFAGNHSSFVLGGYYSDFELPIDILYNVGCNKLRTI
jgi:hypothetical protein